MNPYPLPPFTDLNVAPGRLVWREHAPRMLAETILTLGDEAGVIASDAAFSRLPSFGPVAVRRHRFGGQATQAEIDRAAEELAGVDVVVGAGGGKSLDTAKAVAHDLRRPCVALPTSAATCAAMTALVVLYDVTGRFDRYRYATTAPTVALCCPALLASTPDRLLAAGLADGAAKQVETVSSAGRAPSDLLGAASLWLAERALDLYETAAAGWPHDPAARSAVAYGNVVLSGLSSGIGGMSSFATVAHALANGMTRIVPRPDRLLHGEWIAPLLLSQMRLEGFPAAETDRLDRLFARFGLPRDLAAVEARLGEAIPESARREACRHALSEGETARLSRHPFTAEELLASL